jgi:hypothetical protein
MPKASDLWMTCFADVKRALPFNANTMTSGGKPVGQLNTQEMKEFLDDQEARMLGLLDQIGLTNRELFIGEEVVYTDEELAALAPPPSEQSAEELGATVAEVKETIVASEARDTEHPRHLVSRYADSKDSNAITAADDLLYEVERDDNTLQATLDAYRGEGAVQFSKNKRTLLARMIGGSLDRGPEYDWSNEESIPPNIRILADAIANDARLAKAGKEAMDKQTAGVTEVVDQGDDGPSAFGNFDNADQLYYNEGGRAVPLAFGAVRSAVRSVLNQLRAELPTKVYKSREDFAAKEPDLWRSMVENNPRLQDAESVAAAYHQGKVYVFSDAIYSPNHLRFVLSHEILGHHGLRALIGRAQLAKVLTGLYEQSQMGLAVGTWLADGVDAMRGRNPQIGRLEAIEEVLADKAAALGAEPGVIFRIFKAIKNAIKRLFGIDSPEDMALYTLHQARKYLRTGTITSGFSLDSIIQDVTDLNSKTGQFDSVVLHENDNLAVRQHGASQTVDHTAIEGLQGGWGSFKSKTSDFIHDFYSLQVFSARENPGYRRMNKLFDNARNTASRIRQTANELTARYFGMSGEVELELNKMLYIADALRTSQLQDVKIVVDKNGKRKKISSPKSMEQVLKERGIPSDATDPLFDYLDMGKRPPDLRSTDAFFKAGLLPKEAFKRGIKVVRENFDAEYKRNPKLTDRQFDEAYAAYVQFRKAYRNTEEELVRAKYSNVIDSINIGWEEFVYTVGKNTGNPGQVNSGPGLALFHEIHRIAIDTVVNRSIQLDGGTINNSKEVMEKASKFAIAINTFLRAKDPNINEKGVQERINAIREFFPKDANNNPVDITPFITRLNQLRQQLDYKYESFDQGTTSVVQQSIMKATQEHLSALRDDYNMKWSLMKGYTPVMREGDIQVRVEAVDPVTNKSVSIGQDFESQLLFSMFPENITKSLTDSGRAKAINLAKTLNKEFSGKLYDIANEVDDAAQARNKEPVTKVKLRAIAEMAPKGVQAPPSVDPAAFLRAVNSFGVDLKPSDMNTIIEALTEQDNLMRKQLFRLNTPGYGYLGNKALSKHIEQRASVAGKTSISARINDLFNQSSARVENWWAGDAARVQQLEKELAELPEDNPERPAKQRELDLAKFQYDKTNPADGVSRRKTYKNRAYAALRFYDGQSDVEFSQFDLNGTVSTLRTGTSLAYLGGSIASGMLNIISVFTNVLPYLSTYNSKRAFGGGFGLGKAGSELWATLNTTGSWASFKPDVITRQGDPAQDPNNAAFYERIAREIEKADKGPEHRIDGLTLDEARFLTQEIREGKMIPAISNMVMYSARGMPGVLTKGAKYIDAYMTFFNQTEQWSRRMSGLAAYRLHRDRAIAEAGPNGKPDLNAVYSNAREFAADMLDTTVGEYSAMNRPPIFRNNFLSILYTYKTFPTTMTQLIRNLPLSGQAAMVGGLWLTGGVMALPFMEDMEDIADTISQKLGLSGSSRLYAQRMLNNIAPGLDALVMRGAMQFIPILGTMDVGSRLSLGNQIPLTGSLLAGQNVANDIKEFAGPIVSFGMDSIKTGVLLTGETARLVTGEPTEFAQVFRQSPVSAMRYLSDMWVYSATGAITNKRGAVVAPGDQYAGIFARALGFYPQAAARNNDFSKLVVRESQYHRQLSGGLRDRWVRAMLQGNPDEARAIAEWVNEWNADNPDERINNFTRRGYRALKMWRQSGQRRILSTTPLAIRAQFEEINNEDDDD